MHPSSSLAQAFSAKCAVARAHLRREMEARGLHQSDGWKIMETVRDCVGGSEIVMRPLHLHLQAPDDLECVVRIEEDSSIDSNCDSPLSSTSMQ
jgi:hypothetical protein